MEFEEIVFCARKNVFPTKLCSARKKCVSKEKCCAKCVSFCDSNLVVLSCGFKDLCVFLRIYPQLCPVFVFRTKVPVFPRN